jgi:hypothetical protein
MKRKEKKVSVTKKKLLHSRFSAVIPQLILAAQGIEAES